GYRDGGPFVSKRGASQMMQQHSSKQPTSVFSSLGDARVAGAERDARPDDRARRDGRARTRARAYACWAGVVLPLALGCTASGDDGVDAPPTLVPTTDESEMTSGGSTSGPPPMVNTPPGIDLGAEDVAPEP